MSKRALLSVSNKQGLEPFAQALVAKGWEIISTGGTAKALRAAGVPVTGISEVTGHPEIMDGRVKTLHPAVHGPLLARRDRDEDLEALAGLGYRSIDLVAVNLYPFRETVTSGEVTLEQAMEKVDIGGPTMIRAAAKNHRFVWVVVDPLDYGAVLAALESGEDGALLRRHLAAKVFDHISIYDRAVARFLTEEGVSEDAPPTPPPSFGDALERTDILRYGENPDQPAGFYAYPGGSGLAGLQQLHGKALSYNNYLDLDGALLALAPFAYSPEPTVCIVKHTTPCGLAMGPSLVEAYDLALRTDPSSAFGSVIALNRPVDRATAARIRELFVECVVAPAYTSDALDELSAKKNIRILTMPSGVGATGVVPADVASEAWWTGSDETTRSGACFLALHGRVPSPWVSRSVYGGLLVQAPPRPPFLGTAGESWTVVSERTPTVLEERDLRFAWAAVFGVKSNAILLAADGATLGIGAGQMSRVDASRLAVLKAGQAGLDLQGSALASDAFFPFRDGVDAAAEAGARAIVQPGGSIRDEEVIEAANEHGLAMVFTGRRLFRH